MNHEKANGNTEPNGTKQAHESQTNPLCDLRALHRPLCRTTLPCLKNHIKALFVSGVKCCRNRLEKEPPKWILAPSHDPLHQPAYVRSKNQRTIRQTEAVKLRGRPVAAQAALTGEPGAGARPSMPRSGHLTCGDRYPSHLRREPDLTTFRSLMRVAVAGSFRSSRQVG